MIDINEITTPEVASVETVLVTKTKEVLTANNVGTSVTSTVSVDFPSLDWAIEAGEVKELPADADAQARILENAYITALK